MQYGHPVQWWANSYMEILLDGGQIVYSMEILCNGWQIVISRSC